MLMHTKMKISQLHANVLCLCVSDSLAAFKNNITCEYAYIVHYQCQVISCFILFCSISYLLLDLPNSAESTTPIYPFSNQGCVTCK